MSTKIFVNLPVKDLDRSKAFFGALGYTFDPQFTDENAASMVIADDIFAMLLVEPFFQGFTPKQIVDATAATEVLIGLSAESREEVDALVDNAVAARAVNYAEPQDHGFMYQRSFQDLDGHLWEIIWMDPATVQG